MMKDVVEIVSLILGVAFVALLVGNAQGTATVAQSVGGTFNDILKTVTLQGGGGFGGYSSPNFSAGSTMF